MIMIWTLAMDNDICNRTWISWIRWIFDLLCQREHSNSKKNVSEFESRPW